MNRKIRTTVLGTVIIAVAAAVLIYGMVATGPRAAARAAEGDPAAQPATGPAVSVEVVQPARRPVTRSLRMPATLLAYEAADLYAKASGYVSRIDVDIGSRVRRGDTLLKIDVPEMADELRRAEAVLEAKQAKTVQARSMIDTARAEVERADAAHELTHVSFERTEALRRGNAIPQQDLDEAKSKLAIADAERKISKAKVASADADTKVAEAEVAVAQATVARLRTLMGYATIAAPFDGVITDRRVDPGAFVRSAVEGVTTPLLTVASTDRLRLALEIPEPDAPYVQVGKVVEIDVKAVGDDPIQASVSRTARALKANTRTMRAEVDLDNKDGRLAPGMYARVTVMLETKQQAMVIPSKAIRVRGRDVGVLVADDNVARSMPVELGYDDGIWVEITGGLKGDEKIIVAAGSAIAPGAAVKPVPVPFCGSGGQVSEAPRGLKPAARPPKT